jgi:hypothetical protein
MNTRLPILIDPPQIGATQYSQRFAGIVLGMVNRIPAVEAIGVGGNTSLCLAYS